MAKGYLMLLIDSFMLFYPVFTFVDKIAGLGGEAAIIVGVVITLPRGPKDPG